MVQEFEQGEEDAQRLRPRLPQQPLQRPRAGRRLGQGARSQQGPVEAGGEDGVGQAGQPEAEGAGDLKGGGVGGWGFFL